MSLFGRKEKEHIKNLENKIQEQNSKMVGVMQDNHNLKISQSALRRANENLKEDVSDLRETAFELEKENVKLQKTITTIKKICKSSKSGVIGKNKILEQLGE